MSEYHYQMPEEEPRDKKRTEGEVLSWLLIFVSFAAFWPLGLFLLIRKLSENGDQKEQTEAIPPLWAENAPAAQGKTNAASARKSTRKKRKKETAHFSGRMTKTPSMRRGTRLALKIIGALVLLAGVMGAVETASYFLYPPIYRWELVELVQACVIAGAGGLMLGKGIGMDRALKRYTNYMAIMGNAQSMSFRQLAETTGYSEKKVIDDLERMIGKNYFGSSAYLDMGLGYFFRSRAATETAQQPRTDTSVPKEAEAGYSGILRNIRRANDRIADPVLSRKIERLEEVTAQIFRVIEQDSAKERQVRTFLEYYLPTTQKLLDSYAEFEAAGVNGANLRMAKEKIEATMDDIVRGFENQLDALYAAKAMDIQSDIDVMNHMMRQDSSMGTKDFHVSTDSKDIDLTLHPETGSAAMAAQEE